MAEGRTAIFGNDQDLFNDLRASEVRLWYRIEWSAAVQPPQNFLSEMATRETEFDHCLMYPMNDSDITPFALCHHATDKVSAQVGTISYVQRLRSGPGAW